MGDETHGTRIYLEPCIHLHKNDRVQGRRETSYHVSGSFLRKCGMVPRGFWKNIETADY